MKLEILLAHGSVNVTLHNGFKHMLSFFPSFLASFLPSQENYHKGMVMGVSQCIALIKFSLVQDIFSPNAIFVASFSPLSNLNLQLWRKKFPHLMYNLTCIHLVTLTFQHAHTFPTYDNVVRFCSVRQSKSPYQSVFQ